MSARAMTWVWDHSASKGIDRLVMLAVADESSENGRFSASVSTLARKSGVDVRTVQRALHRLATGDGAELALLAGEVGPRGTRVYRLRIDPRARVTAPPVTDDHPRQADTGAQSPPAESHPRQAATPKPVQKRTKQAAPVAERHPSSTKANTPVATQPAEPESLTKRAQRLAKIYTDLVPLSKFPAVMMIAKKAIDAEYDDEQITGALQRLAAEGRPVTVDTLRIELEGFAPRRRATPAAALPPAWMTNGQTG